MVFVNPLIMTAVDTIEKYEVKSGQGITIPMHTGSTLYYLHLEFKVTGYGIKKPNNLHSIFVGIGGVLLWRYFGAFTKSIVVKQK